MTEATQKVTALRSHDALGAGEALRTKDAYKDEAWWRWDAMIKGGAVARTETPATCIAKAAVGDAYGWPPVIAVSRVYLVDGRPCLAAEAMLGLVRDKRPQAEIVKVSHDATHCIVKGRRGPEEPWHHCEFTEQDAQRAGLLGKKNWKTYPKAMYWARAVSMLTRELFSDITLGAHTPEEAEHGFTVSQAGPQDSPPLETEPEVIDGDDVDDWYDAHSEPEQTEIDTGATLPGDDEAP